MVEFCAESLKAHNNLAQGAASGQDTEHHGDVLIPRFDGLVPLVGLSGFENTSEAVSGRQAKDLAKNMLSGKNSSFVQVVYLFCGKNKLTTIKGVNGPLS